MGEAEIMAWALAIEHKLRTGRVPPADIPAVLGAAFTASLSDLSRAQQRRVLAAHLVAVHHAVADIILENADMGRPQ